jgi:hypothetical protein
MFFSRSRSHPDLTKIDGPLTTDNPDFGDREMVEHFKKRSFFDEETFDQLSAYHQRDYYRSEEYFQEVSSELTEFQSDYHRFYAVIYVFLRIINKWKFQLKTPICWIFRRGCISYKKLCHHQLEWNMPITVDLQPQGLDKLDPNIAQLFDHRFMRLAGRYSSLSHFKCELHRFNCLVIREHQRNGDYCGSMLDWKPEIEDDHLYYHLRWLGDNVEWDPHLPDIMGTIHFTTPVRILPPEHIPSEMKSEVNAFLAGLNVDQTPDQSFTIEWVDPLERFD